MDENFLDNRSFESYPDVSYSLPISFGFTVRKDLSRRIAVVIYDIAREIAKSKKILMVHSGILCE